MRTRRGFTLIELLVALLLLTIVLGGIYRLLNNTQRISRAQAEHVDMQSNMRAGSLIVPSELRAIGFDSIPLATADAIVPDLEDLQPNSVTFRTVRSLGFICQILTTPDRLIVGTTAAANYSQLRDPNASPGDSLMVFVEKDPTTTSDDRWVSRGISGTPTATTCPDGSAARSFRTSFAVTTPSAPANDPLANTDFTVGSPIRTFEVVKYKLYQDASGLYYLGAESVSNSAVVQPVLGPLRAADGFRLDYFDKNGTAIATTTAADKRNVRAIQVTLSGVSSQNVTTDGYGSQRQAVDSVVTLVQLRNAVHR
jgi:prepilin-type N-terminal cleavage/methylation domain-containing protein